MKWRIVDVTQLDHLPKSIVTILRDFAFPIGFNKEGIRKAVLCEEDLTIITSEISEQMHDSRS